MKKLSFAIAAFLGLSVGAMAQAPDNEASHSITVTVPEVFKVRLHPNTGTGTFDLAMKSPLVAGDPITVSNPNATLQLQYSSIVEATGTDGARTVVVGATIPTGIDLNISAAAAGGSAVGTVASGAGITPVVLTSAAASGTLLSGIGSCYTGITTASGHTLSYTASPQLTAGYSTLVAATTAPITVTYTISGTL